MRIRFGRGFGHRGGMFGRRRYYRQASLGGTVLTVAVVMVFLAIESGNRDRRVPDRPPPVQRAASVIEPGLPAIQLLQRVGSPTCRERIDVGERWIYARADAEPAGCMPSDGDLVVVVQDDRIARFTPEHGRSNEVAGPQDMDNFRRRYLGR